MRNFVPFCEFIYCIFFGSQFCGFFSLIWNLFSRCPKKDISAVTSKYAAFCKSMNGRTLIIYQDEEKSWNFSLFFSAARAPYGWCSTLFFLWLYDWSKLNSLKVHTYVLQYKIKKQMRWAWRIIVVELRE